MHESGLIVAILSLAFLGCSGTKGASCEAGCGFGDKVTGWSCDLGLGDYTAEMCDQAALAAGCASHSFTQTEEAMCTPPQPRTRNCCHYTDCKSDPALPSPAGPDCPLWLDAGSPIGSPSGHKRVFTTSKELNASRVGSLDGADKICLDAATSAGLGGAWKAWLSDDHANAIDRIADVGPWYLTDQKNTLAFADKASLTGRPGIALDWDENGRSIYYTDSGGMPTSTETWTGTGNDGKSTGKHCSNWTTTDGFGEVGNVLSQMSWTSTGYPRNCDATSRLYCFEQ